MENPFSLEPYTTKERFCDREQELKDIISFLTNGSNVTLISPRRYGKTGLIFRTFDTLQETFHTTGLQKSRKNYQF